MNKEGDFIIKHCFEEQIECQFAAEAFQYLVIF
jgi:hypothetical protein